MCRITIRIRELVEPEERKGIQNIVARALSGFLDSMCFEWRRRDDNSTLTVRGEPTAIHTEIDGDDIAARVGKDANVQVY